jgi:hypothetical protein
MAETESVQAPELIPPVQLVLRCPECGYERTTLALHPSAVEGAKTCERCSRPTRIVAYRPMHNGCSCCLL